MRRLILVFALLALDASAECITVTYKGVGFFRGAKVIFYGVADSETTLRVESVLRGTKDVGSIVPVIPMHCRYVVEGSRYLVVQRCPDPSDNSCIGFVEDKNAASLLEALEKEHAETYDTIMKRFIDWLRGDAEMEEWIHTASVKPRSEDDDELAAGLISDIEDSFHFEVPKEDLRALLPLIESFPHDAGEDRWEFEDKIAEKFVEIRKNWIKSQQ